MTELFRLDGAVAVVSGASGWLGCEMVTALASAGAHVVAVGRDQGRLEAALGETVAEVREADVTDGSWPELLAAVGDAHGRIDVLVNNAHIGRGGSLATATADLFDEAHALAVKGAWRAIQAARPWLCRAVELGTSPSVVNVSSMYGMVAPDLSLYTTEAGRTPPYYGAAKAGLLQLSRYAAAELGPEGIRVNSLTPGPFPATAARENPEFIEELGRRTMLGKVGDPRDIATALLFLASPHSRFVTGSNVVVDGGWTSR